MSVNRSDDPANDPPRPSGRERELSPAERELWLARMRAQLGRPRPSHQPEPGDSGRLDGQLPA